MFFAELVCSDPECPETLEAYGGLEELDWLLCECGCTMQAVVWGESEPAEPAAPAAQPLPLAA